MLIYQRILLKIAPSRDSIRVEFVYHYPAGTGVFRDRICRMAFPGLNLYYYIHNTHIHTSRRRERARAPLNCFAYVQVQDSSTIKLAINFKCNLAKRNRKSQRLAWGLNPRTSKQRLYQTTTPPRLLQA